MSSWGPAFGPSFRAATTTPPPGGGGPTPWPIYATPQQLAAQVGYPQGKDQELEAALVMASRWVDRELGYLAPHPFHPWQLSEVDPLAPFTVQVVPVDIGAHRACLVAAVRFLRSPDVPFGVAGGLGDLAIRVYADIPEARLHLLGLHNSWGVA